MFGKDIWEIATIVGTSFPIFGVFLTAYFGFLSIKKDPFKLIKKKILIWCIHILILLVFFAISIILGNAIYNKNYPPTNKPIAANYISCSNKYRTPQYAIDQADKMYYSYITDTDFATDHRLLLTNSNGIDVSIISIKAVIDKYQPTTPKYVFYFQQKGKPSDNLKNIYRGLLRPYEQESGLTIDPSSDEILTIKANSELPLSPQVRFSKSGFYEFHYVIEYSLNGSIKKLVLPPKTLCITKQQEPVEIPPEHSYLLSKVEQRVNETIDSDFSLDLYRVLDDILDNTTTPPATTPPATTPPATTPPVTTPPATTPPVTTPPVTTPPVTPSPTLCNIMFDTQLSFPNKSEIKKCKVFTAPSESAYYFKIDDTDTTPYALTSQPIYVAGYVEDSDGTPWFLIQYHVKADQTRIGYTKDLPISTKSLKKLPFTSFPATKENSLTASIKTICQLTDGYSKIPLYNKKNSKKEIAVLGRIGSDRYIEVYLDGAKQYARGMISEDKINWSSESE